METSRWVMAFTGSRKGMTPAQRWRFRCLVLDERPDEFHHGACVGSDEQASGIISALREGSRFRCLIQAHPGRSPPHLQGAGVWDVRTDSLPNLARNNKLAKLCDVLVAAPKGMAEEVRSGTWATVRYARAAGKRVVLVFPDGSKRVEAAKTSTG